MERERQVDHLKKVRNYYDVGNSLFNFGWHRGSYGLHYGIWREGIKSRAEAINYQNKYLSEFARVKSGDLVLDLGCGIGGSSLWLRKNVGARVVGIDIVKKHLKKASEISELKDTGFLMADFHNIPFRVASFDVVWALEVLEHALDIEEIIRESSRVLKPGGRIVIASVLKGGTTPSNLQHRQLADVLVGVARDNKTGIEVLELMKEVGFKNVELRDLTSLVMRSSQDMTRISRLGMPFSRFLVSLNIVSPILIKWGLYQEGLLRSGVLEYDILLGSKPK